MINKKNLLGKKPEQLGTKDAIHTAIVAVRAASAINPGERCKLNEHREAVPDSKGCGCADPFLKSTIMRGDFFWLLLCQDEVPNVQHVWDHPDVDFSPPTREVERNRTIKKYADEYQVTYEQVMEAADFVVEHDKPATYPGELNAEDLESVNEDLDQYDFWAEWSDEANHEFENEGSACCPEYRYPDVIGLFKHKVATPA